MSGASFTIAFQPGRVITAMAALNAALRSPEPLLRAIGVGLLRNTQDRFDAETAPDGSRWAPLSPGYIPFKRGAGILRGAGMRGGLQGSITSDVSGGAVIIGTNKIYGAVHQFGATITPKGAGVLVLRDYKGRAFGRARSVTIPARPYLGLSARDEETILEITEDHLERVLRRG